MVKGCESEQILRQLAFNEVKVWSMRLGDPKSESLKASYYTEQESIWFRGGYLYHDRTKGEECGHVKSI